MSPPAGTSIRLFGGLRVECATGPVAVPSGAPAMLLRIVATYGAMHVEELSELLWPGSPSGVGRGRIRNVLSRLRSACGDVVVRVGESVAVADDVAVDVAAFEATARRALGIPPGGPDRATTAKAALALSQEALLPEDVYRDWAAGPRERARRYRLQLLDLLAEDAAAVGDVAGALRRWQEGIALEPYDEARYLSAATLLLGCGRWGAALGFVQRAEEALTALGLPPSPVLVTLRRRLREEDVS